MDYRDILNGFIQGGRKEEIYVRKLLKGLISPSMEKILRKRIGDDYEDEIISELRYRIVKNRDYWSSLEFINLKYFRSIIRNTLIDIINGVEVNILSLQEYVFKEDDAKPITYEDIIQEDRDAFAQTEGSLLYKVMLESLKEEELLVLCYYFDKFLYRREAELSGVSKDALYKRWERLKKGKLRNILQDVSPEEMRAFVEKFLSEICGKRGYISNTEAEL